MHAPIPGVCALAVLAISLLGMAKTADAAPFSAPTTPAATPGADAPLLVPVQLRYRERRVVIREREYEPDYYVRDDDYHDRPHGYVYGWRSYDDYDDYDDDYDGGVRVRAPFVDIYIR